MVQAGVLDGQLLDFLSPFNDGGVTPGVGVSGGATSLLAAQLLLRFLGYVFAPGNDARESLAISK